MSTKPYSTTPTVPDTDELSAAIAGLMMAMRKQPWQGIRPQGEGTADDAQEVVVDTGRSLREDIFATMSLAQQRWPNAAKWELIGADDRQWHGARTYAEFLWPAASETK
jgi:hypothetical protein